MPILVKKFDFASDAENFADLDTQLANPYRLYSSTAFAWQESVSPNPEQGLRNIIGKEKSFGHLRFTQGSGLPSRTITATWTGTLADMGLTSGFSAASVVATIGWRATFNNQRHSPRAAYVTSRGEFWHPQADPGNRMLITNGNTNVVHSPVLTLVRGGSTVLITSKTVQPAADNSYPKFRGTSYGGLIQSSYELRRGATISFIGNPLPSTEVFSLELSVDFEETPGAVRTDTLTDITYYSRIQVRPIILEFQCYPN